MNELCLRGHRPRLEHDGSPRVATRDDLANMLESTALEMLRIAKALRSDGVIEETYYLQHDIHLASTTLEAFASDGLLDPA